MRISTLATQIYPRVVKAGMARFRLGSRSHFGRRGREGGHEGEKSRGRGVPRRPAHARCSARRYPLGPCQGARPVWRHAREGGGSNPLRGDRGLEGQGDLILRVCPVWRFSRTSRLISLPDEATTCEPWSCTFSTHSVRRNAIEQKPKSQKKQRENKKRSWGPEDLLLCFCFSPLSQICVTVGRT